MTLREATIRRDVALAALESALQRPRTLRRDGLCRALVRLVNCIEYEIAREAAAAGDLLLLEAKLDTSGVYQIDFAHVGGVP